MIELYRNLQVYYIVVGVALFFIMLTFILGLAVNILYTDWKNKRNIRKKDMKCL